MKNVEWEMSRMGIYLLGLAQVRWPGMGRVDTDEVSLVYFGGDTAVRVVGMTTTRKLAQSVVGCWAESD